MAQSTPETSAAPLTIVSTYALIGSAAEFSDAIKRLAAKVEAEGETGVLSYRFYVSEAETTARAVIDYASPAAWIGHHEIAMDWPEMAALHRVARLDEVIFLGPYTPEIGAWLAKSSLTAKVHHGFNVAAGFSRRS